jgi:Protein of unknown function (DUF3040)
VERWGRRLDRIEQQLAADDPELAEAFALWEERCGRVPRAEPDELPEWAGALLAVLACLAVLAALVAALDASAAW